MTERHLVTIQVAGRPASYFTTHEKPWKDSVRAAVAATGVQPQNARFAVRLEFRVAAPRSTNGVWDLDNLIRPALDAMEGIFGLRPWKRKVNRGLQTTGSIASRPSNACHIKGNQLVPPSTRVGHHSVFTRRIGGASSHAAGRNVGVQPFSGAPPTPSC